MKVDVELESFSNKNWAPVFFKIGVAFIWVNQGQSTRNGKFCFGMPQVKLGSNGEEISLYPDRYGSRSHNLRKRWILRM